MEKAKAHLQRMEDLRNGKTMDCPYCKKGKIRKKNDSVFLCDVCGKGIVPRIKIDFGFNK